MVTPSRILLITACLVLGSASVANAQMQYDLTNEIQFASLGEGSKTASASHCASSCGVTNQHLSFRLVPAPKGEPDLGLSYSMLPVQLRGESELNQPNLPSRVRLSDLVRTTSPQGWRIGDGGILGYRNRDRRFRFVVRYTPDFHSILQDFDRLDSFSLVWQLSLGKMKPAN